MALRDLSSAGFLDVGQTRVDHKGKRALAFVFDASFLRAFKVLAYTLVATRSCLDLPVFVFTQDRKVYDDPVVAAVADRRIFITEKDISQFENISREKVRREKQLSWIPKYTFLKWLVFDDHDVDDLLFIDADIVTLSPCDEIFDDAAGTDMAIAPRFLPSLYSADGARLPPEEVADRYRALLSADFPADHININSGVMVLSGRCLSASFRQQLLKTTEAHALVNEQSYITAMLQNETDLSWRMISSKYNFNAGMLDRVRLHEQIKLLSEIVFLHYPGKIKPWSRPVRNASSLAHMVWRRCETEALEQSELLGSGKSLRRVLRDWG